jgi:hypothetical protein
VCGLGRICHREFAMGAGEMSPEAFTALLQETLGHAAVFSRDGAIAFVCMDWRHMGELLAAGRAVFSELKNLCVWNKTNGGMGSFYRSKHELVFLCVPASSMWQLAPTKRSRRPPQFCRLGRSTAARQATRPRRKLRIGFG